MAIGWCGVSDRSAFFKTVVAEQDGKDDQDDNHQHPNPTAVDEELDERLKKTDNKNQKRDTAYNEQTCGGHRCLPYCIIL